MRTVMKLAIPIQVNGIPLSHFKVGFPVVHPSFRPHKIILDDIILRRFPMEILVEILVIIDYVFKA